MPLYMVDIVIFITNINFVYFKMFMTSPPEMAVGPWSLYGGLFINF